MNELNNTHNRPYVKSARVVGDASVGTTLMATARCTKPWCVWLKISPCVICWSTAKALAPLTPTTGVRYTEVRMAKMASELLADLDKDTVDFVNNYDDTLTMPDVLPTRVPNLLVNGSSGIAVGMATNIPPHNLTEVINACLQMLINPTHQPTS